ncbi:HAD-IA family hydrolase [Paenibacillus sp. sptzw28]|uniref:HAD family hydrolase n=1 Tax=Paenibacillus sp. sptzw28 TaxID=715179 RepID=UPI001C6E3FC1|nr:HAD-IA family hydrolase [Paenibacillus sp. sptzw28]QYR22981.1 HAD-IA family hydrolase [Paenibacillus sp. sptzw28]
MTVKPQLVLDAGGVLVTNLSPLFWRELAGQAEVPYDRLYANYRREISESLWTGEIAEEEFWSWLSKQLPSADPGQARRLLAMNLKPLPALDKLNEWCRDIDIHLLSNHRIEWLSPIIDSIRPCLKSVTVSSTVGCSKPHPAIYECAVSNLASTRNVLFVDDQAKNFEQASILGWNTLLADPQGDWTEKVFSLLFGTASD